MSFNFKLETSMKIFDQAIICAGGKLHGDWYESRCNIAECDSYSREFSPFSEPDMRMILRLVFPWQQEDVPEIPDFTPELEHPFCQIFSDDNRTVKIAYSEFDVFGGEYANLFELLNDSFIIPETFMAYYTGLYVGAAGAVRHYFEVAK